MTRTQDVQIGMTVYSEDGTYLGQIKEVYAETALHGFLPVSQYLLQDYGVIRGTSSLLDTTDGYLQVQQGGVFSADRQVLRIPLADVQSVTARESATVQVSETLGLSQCDEIPQQFRRAA